jgi:hypothetical protein
MLVSDAYRASVKNNNYAIGNNFAVSLRLKTALCGKAAPIRTGWGETRAMSALQLRRNEENARQASVQIAENDERSFENRRASPREPARDLCEILTDGLRYAMSCMAHNISATGALLETSLTGVPDRFILVNHTRHTRSVCQVVWRCGRMVGVRFTRPPRSIS